MIRESVNQFNRRTASPLRAGRRGYEGHEMSLNEQDELMAQGKYLRLVRRGNWECVLREGTGKVVGIVGITNDGKLLLIEQYRPPVKAKVLELPAGLVGDHTHGGEDPAEAARRELEEETGYRAEKMELLVRGAISAGMSDEIMYTYKATGLTRVSEGGGDETEDIEVFEVPLAEVDGYLKRRSGEGVILDVKLYAGLYLAGILPPGK